uniref:Zinc finger and BTB domain containing 22a n=1 Tax=Poecilia formosa TaxID=48698 RepID=A0A096LZI7_POEFO
MDPTCCDAVAPPSLTVQVCFPGVRAAVLDNLNRQREEGRLCDLSIQVQGQVFRAHRCVLAASSPYFHDQVLLKNVTTVSLPSVLDPVAFQSVLSSAYTGQLSIIHDDIVNYVTVASFLQMWHIVDKCTEILKRPRPSAEPGAAAGSASRQQSPSSTECLYAEREGRRRDRKPDALPPLATWRRPQQEARWTRPRPSSEQNPADSQLDGLPSYPDREPPGCQEEWITSPAKPGPSGHDGPGQSGRYLGMVPAAEAPKQKVRFQQRGEETQEKRRKAMRETEADEGVGEEEEEAKDGFTQIGRNQRENGKLHRSIRTAMIEKTKEEAELQKEQELLKETAAQFQGVKLGSQISYLRVPGGAEDGGRSAGRPTLDLLKDRLQRDDPSSQVHDVPAGGPGAPGPPCGSWPDEEDMADGNWPSSSAAFPPPPPSPPTPSSSSSASGAGGYAGKVHLCHCGKAYTLKSMRDRHVKMQHLNLRPFGCPVCTKSFKMKHHLTKHLKTHGGLRPYECSLCGKKVVWRDSFLRHQARCQR